MPAMGRLTSLLFLGLATACSDENPVQEIEAFRPVSALRLKSSNPGSKTRLTGAVGPWRQEDLAFEIPGRLIWVIDEGLEVEARHLGEDGSPLLEGTAIARLDPLPYELERARAQAQLQAAKAQVVASRLNLEKILPRQLAEAEVDRNLAIKDRNRARDLFQQGVGPEADLDQAQARLDTAEAALDRAQASLEAGQADLEALEAQAALYTEALKQAERDLANCTLYSPFSGQVAEIHVIQGAVVAAGSPVANVVVMDPVKIELAVSAETDRQIPFHSIVSIHPPNSEDALPAVIWRKDTIADPATRTFRLTLLTRNSRSLGKQSGESAGIKEVTGFRRPMYREKFGEGSLFLGEQALYGAEGAEYVWEVVGARADLTDTPDFQNGLAVRRLNISTAGGSRWMLGVFPHRELVDPASIRPDSLLVVGAPDDLQDGDRVGLAQERWLLRPGDLVEIELGVEKIQPGFYVPMEAIVARGEASSVFVVEQGKARLMAVKLLETVGELKRIEAESLREGMEIVVQGCHYLFDGDPIKVLRYEELQP
ncbi:MAG: HlyD family efflux transporter periplasmic adaptor subunit [Planctomycetota bacterium]|nr:MAG: HlyD family efflux transporter periplasmic adaptor subunit [Planctomycetota bacterium]